MKFYLNAIKVLKFSHIRHLSTKSTAYDVCIVGGGPVGFGFASILGSSKYLQNKKILVVESQRKTNYQQKENFSVRTVALSPVTKTLLENCGAWEFIKSGRYRPVEKMFVWEQSSESFISFDKTDSKSNDDVNLAFIVENDLLQHAVTSVAEQSQNIDVVYDTKVNEMKMGLNGAQLKLSDGTNVDCTLLVGCDGFKSAVRKNAKIQSTVQSYDQKAIVAVVKFDGASENNVAWQRFTRNGTIAYLPLDDEHSNLIWCTTTEHVNQLLKAEEDQFVDELNKEMFTNEYRASWLNPIEKGASNLLSVLPNIDNTNSVAQLPPKVADIIGAKLSFPLGFMHATRYVGPSVALMGDACHRILPLAGQGVNLGLADAACLGRLLEVATQEGQMSNDSLLLHQYETERQRHVLPVASTIQALHWLYTSQLEPIVAARALGLKFVNVVAPIKKLFLEGATEGRISILGRPF